MLNLASDQGVDVLVLTCTCINVNLRSGSIFVSLGVPSSEIENVKRKESSFSELYFGVNFNLVLKAS